MYRSLSRALTVLVVAGATALTAPAAPSVAAPPEREIFSEPADSTDPDFCGSGMTVDFTGTLSGHFLSRARGRDGLRYAMENLRLDQVATNRANGEWVRLVDTVLLKDLRVTDNGDGTLTVLVLGTGNTTLSDSDGKALARNPGQLRFEILLDHRGTPGDPADDRFLAFLGIVKDSTGRSDDLCAAAVAALR